MYEVAYVQKIYAYNPKSKLIAILRDPVHRAYSHWNMQRQKAIEPRNFLAAIADELSFKSVDKRFAYLSRGLYYKQIKNLINHFPQKQVLVIIQDNLLHHPLSTLTKVSSFLAVSPWLKIKPIRAHEGEYSENLSPEIEREIRGFFRNDLLMLESLLDEDLSSWM